MKKILVFLLLVLLLSGCGRRVNQNSAAAHLGEPTSVQIISEDYPAVTIRDKGQIRDVMAILEKTEVRKLSYDEEVNLVLVQGKTLNAIELRFRDSRGNEFKALLLDDGSVLVVEGARGESEQRRDLFLSEPGQQELVNQIQKQIISPQ
ncbi:MAG: lipoprotein [Bacillota bacterium]|nr:lipoprotein [Bacillota bacterium]MDW7683879.1 lipoprotein [Bacillota bacterium]